MFTTTRSFRSLFQQKWAGKINRPLQCWNCKQKDWEKKSRLWYRELYRKSKRRQEKILSIGEDFFCLYFPVIKSLRDSIPFFWRYVQSSISERTQRSIPYCFSIVQICVSDRFWRSSQSKFRERFPRIQVASCDIWVFVRKLKINFGINFPYTSLFMGMISKCMPNTIFNLKIFKSGNFYTSPVIFCFWYNWSWTCLSAKLVYKTRFWSIFSSS